jgi:hypothetical protein
MLCNETTAAGAKKDTAIDEAASQKEKKIVRLA